GRPADLVVHDGEANAAGADAWLQRRERARPSGGRRHAEEGPYRRGGTGSAAVVTESNTSRKPSRQLAYAGSQPSARLIFSFEDPRMSVIIDTPASPIAKRASHAGTCRGAGAPSKSARYGSHVATSAGSSSTTLKTPGFCRS